ncbi:hypothetical protein BH23ACT5_BH23ACT5_18620 [soil metagenome]
MNDKHVVADIDAAGRSFLSVVAHELRAPLTSVLGLLALLEDGSVNISDQEARELATMGKGEADRMLLIIENLLLATRIAQGGLVALTEEVDLQSVVRDTLGGLPGVARRAFVPIDRSAVVVADRNLVSQIVTNLMQNVERYAPTGEVEVRFEVRDGQVEMSVSDDGPGVPSDRSESVFSDPRSDKGLGMGLSISRQLARVMDGDLVLAAEPLRSGATFTLLLPAANPRSVPVEGTPASHSLKPEVSVLAPSARLLVDMTEVLADRSLDRLVAGLQNMFTDLLGASAGHLVIRDRDGLRRAGSFGASADQEITETPILKEVFESGRHSHLTDLVAADPTWAELLGSRSGLFLPVPGDEEILGVLAIGWDRIVEPSPRLLEVATALARLAAFGADRAALAADVMFERQLRSSVLEAFPIAISVFAGDPPRLVDTNRAERRMLGINSDGDRPEDIVASQRAFDVRFADGTRLTLENSPVTQTIRTGLSTGPFFLRVRRADGSEVQSRTYCAPFFDQDGSVAGAVVSSEEVDQAEIDDHPSSLPWASFARG